MVQGYEIIIVGGGLAGAAFAKAMAQNGAHVLVVERETRFRDRIRGEVLGPWGVAELRKLGLDHLLLESCARELRWFETYLECMRIARRDLPATNPFGLPAMNWVHYDMEEVLLHVASDAGAEVRRVCRCAT